MNAPVYSPCSGIMTSAGPFGSTWATVRCLRHPISSKLNPISVMTALQTPSTRIRVRKFSASRGLSSTQQAFALGVDVEAKGSAGLGILLDQRISNMRTENRAPSEYKSSHVCNRILHNSRLLRGLENA